MLSLSHLCMLSSVHQQAKKYEGISAFLKNVLSTPTFASSQSFFQNFIPSAGSHTRTCTDTDLYTSPINARLSTKENSFP